MSLIATLIILGCYLIKSRKLNLFVGKRPLAAILGSVFIVLVISISVLFFFASVEEALPYPPLSRVTVFLKEHTNLQYKTFWGQRDVYMRQGLMAFANNPFWGIGPHNLRYASEKYMQEPDQLSYSSHNIFLDIFFENGLLAGSFFLAFVVLIVIRAKNKLVSPFIFAFLALLFNFQTFYTFDMYSMLFLFFILAGLNTGVARIRDCKINPRHLLAITSIILLIVAAKGSSDFFHKRDQNFIAFYLYPLNKDVYPPLIKKSSTLLALYEKLFSGDPEVLENIGDAYFQLKDKNRALLYYEKAFYAKKFNDMKLLRKLYRLKAHTHCCV